MTVSAFCLCHSLAIFEHILRTMEMSNKPPHTFGLFTFSPPEHLSADLAFQNKSVPSQNAGRIDSRLQMTSIVSCKISRLWPLNERQQPLCQTSLWKLRFLASLCRPCPAFERIIQLVVTTCNGCWKKKSHHIGFVNRLGFPKQIRALTKCRKDWQ